MVTASTHLHFNGSCLEALKFYEKSLGGKIVFSTTWAEGPKDMKIPEGWGSKILHASLEFEGQRLTADDAPPSHYSKPQGFEVLLSYTDLSQAERVFKALAEKGQVLMPFGKTFWAKGFGMTIDQFGIPWMINCSDPKVQS